MKKKIACILSLAMLTLSGCNGVTPDKIVFVSEMPDEVLLIVGDEQCNLSQMRLLLGNNRNNYGNAYSLDIWESDNETAKAELSEYVNNTTLSHWTKILSMNALAKEYDIELSENASNAVEAAASKYYTSLSDSDIEITGITEEDVANMYRQLAVSDMVYEELTKDVSFEVSNDESRVMEIMIIFTENEETADLVEAELADGADFGALAANYNEYRSIELNLYRGMLDDTIEEAAFKLENGENTGKLRGDDGWYFIYCVNKYNEELSNQNKENIVTKRRTDAFNTIYELFEDNVDIKYNSKQWTEVIREDLSEIKTDNFLDIFDKNFVSTRYK